ncbi:MAG: S8 family serine peptidase, partial [Thermoanaerobaculia bacterium]
MHASAAAIVAASLLLAVNAPAAEPIGLAAGVLLPDSPHGRALAASRPAGIEPALRVVQLEPAALGASLDTLRSAGMSIVDHLSGSTYLVRGNALALARLDGLAVPRGPVVWHGDWAAELKLDAAARRALRAVDGVDTWAIQLVDDPIASRTTLELIAQKQIAPERVRFKVLNFLDIVVTLPASAAAEVAARPDVVSMRRFIEPIQAGERDAQIVAGNVSSGVPSPTSYLSWLAKRGFTQAQFTASNFLVDMADSGIDVGTLSPNHPGLKTLGTGASRIGYVRLIGTPNASSTLQGCDGHGTLSAHVLAGYNAGTGAPSQDGEGFHYGLGVCPFVKLGSSVIYDAYAFTNPDYLSLMSRAYQDGARISSNGWGFALSGAYDIVAQAYDALVRDAQPVGATVSVPGNQAMVVVAAAGNQGPSSGILSPASAKNVLTVGAAEGVQSFGGADQCGVDDLLADSADDMHPASSRGPAADGRAKPDLVAPGTHVSGGVPQAAAPAANGTALACYASATPASLSICAGTGTLPAAAYFPPSGQQLFTASSGTSMATAAVSGAAALLRQSFLNAGRSAPSPAMTKAVLMNSARYLVGAGANDTLPSPAQGMGEVDLGDALDRVAGTSAVLRDELAEDLFTASAQTRTFTGNVLDASKPFRVTLAWTDAPGSTAGNAWNNDLDLTVTVGGSTYLGNTFTGPLSAAGGIADIRNNVESVFLPAGTSGPFTVTITASSINSDGVPGNASALDQDFALVIANTPSAARLYTLLPCRVVDTRDVAGPLGGPSLVALDTRMFVIGGQCAV